jgi:hypothetical protein
MVVLAAIANVLSLPPAARILFGDFKRAVGGKPPQLSREKWKKSRSFSTGLLVAHTIIYYYRLY